MKTVFITVWFGPLPEFFDLFRASCYHNKRFDWIVYTDQKNIKSKNNVKIKHITKDRFISLARKKLGSTVTTLDKDPRKVTDFKPFYGIMFDRDIKRYDFHGHCDLDIIWGSMRLVEEMCKVYDVISSRREAASGHMMMFRKNSGVISALLDNKYKHKYIDLALHDDKFCKYDECGFSHHIKKFSENTGATIFAQWGICNYTRLEVLKRVPPDWYSTKTERQCGNGFSDYVWGESDARWIWKNKKLFSPAGHEITYLHFLTCTQNVTITGDANKFDHIEIHFPDSEHMCINYIKTH